ncbi:thermonuclease family protein [Mesorhizobium sp. M0118]|uniref:thermonuclease family protein n=1 Tax=Mesorhizobium sp. M0118 TaxID=2956884 RepID=UPI00333BDCAA
MDKSRYDDRSSSLRKRTGAGRSLVRRWASVPMRLVLVTVAAVSALVTQFVMHNSGSLPEINLQNVIKPRPVAISGIASVIDGDTIQIHGQGIRFNGIDAPESAQQCDDANGFHYQCGAKSAAALDAFLAASRPAQCTFVSWHRYGRYVGNCRRADGASVAAWMVENGEALDWPKYSQGAYAMLQEKAKAARVGIWAGTFEAPWDWRAEHRADNDQPSTIAPLLAASPGACNIKGNINARGEHIYHIPGQEYYDRTVISTSKGERWFCSDEEAVAAGWRNAKR